MSSSRDMVKPMRSGRNCDIEGWQVHSWALGLLVDAMPVKDHDWNSTATIVLGIIGPGTAVERRLDRPLPKHIRLGKWNVVIDWHVEPYYKEPLQSRNKV